MRDFEWFEPVTVSEAVSLLSKYRGKAKIFAGGTDLLVTMKQGLVSPECLINIKEIPSLNGIAYDEKEGFTIGASTPLYMLETSSLIEEKIGVLAQAIRQVAAERIRSVATLAGNLCQDSKCLHYARTHLWGLVPCYRGEGDTCHTIKGAKSCQAMSLSDTAPALICLDAKVCINGPVGERTIPVEDFFVSAGVTKLQEDEIITLLKIPNVPAFTGGAYLKHTLRGSLDFAIAGAAVVLTLESKNGVCSDVRIALNGVARTPMRVTRAEEVLRGNRVDNNSITQAAQIASEEVRPWSDIFGSANYRRKVVNVVVRQAIEQAFEVGQRA